MSCKNYIIAACIFVMLSNTESVDELERENVKIGGTCERDRECIQGAYCKNEICRCDNEFHYTLSGDGQTCHISFGAYCEDHAKCATMTNAECKQHKCVCKDNFVIDQNNSSNCIVGKHPGDTCHSTEECRSTMNGASCEKNKCDCYPNHHFINETGKCVVTRGLHESCEHNDECFLGKNNPNVLECRNEKCACREGEGRCTDPTRPGDFCRRNEDCEHTMGTAECDNSKCICKPDYRFIHQRGKCLKIQGLNQPCEYNDECFQDKKTPNAFECRNGKCACKGKAPCSKASSSLHHTIFEFLLILSLGVVGMLLC